MKQLRALLLIMFSSCALFGEEATLPAQNSWTITGPLALDGVGTLASECVCTGFSILHTGQVLIQYNLGSPAGMYDDSQWQYVPNFSSTNADPSVPVWDGATFGQIPHHAKFRIVNAAPGAKVFGYKTATN